MFTKMEWGFHTCVLQYWDGAGVHQRELTSMVNQLDPNPARSNITDVPRKNWMEEFQLSVIRSAPDWVTPEAEALAMEQGIAGDIPERHRHLKMAQKQLDAQKAYQKGDYKGAEEKIREVLNFLRDRISETYTLALVRPQGLLARSISKQRKDALAEFDEAIRVGRESPVPLSNKELAELYLAKADNALDCFKDPNIARLAAKEGIQLLRNPKDAAERRLLADLYTARAEAHADLGSTMEAAKNLEFARAFRN